jgi:hypothetical protein
MYGAVPRTVPVLVGEGLYERVGGGQAVGDGDVDLDSLAPGQGRWLEPLS